MILIVSDKFDKHADKVQNLISEEHSELVRLNLDTESLLSTLVSYNQKKGWMWRLPSGEQFSSNDIDSFWIRRPFVELTLEEQEDTSIDFKIWKNEWNKTLLGFYNSIRTIPTLNTLKDAYRSENKYYQMELARKVGFLMPDFLVSNDREMIHQFLLENASVVLKLLHQDFYKVSENKYQGFYVNKLDINDFNIFSEIGENPIFLQKYVEKKFEVRYTVVNDKHFACRIDSQLSEKTKYDWRRYDIPHTPHYKMFPPKEIQEKVTAFMNLANLKFGALDFIVTPENNWFFLEVNTMGQWLWIENLTALPISNAIADFLIKSQK